ncbi:MAG: alpha/beta hydrolase [Bdellovibrio sp.]|nr:alpha/beta hydrolase [Bdellovibrio sp.]
MKKLLLVFALVMTSSAAFAEVQYQRLAKGKMIAYEHIVRQPNGATLILLPGVNRSLESSDRAVRLLLEQGWNLLLPSLPAHPLSVSALDKYEIPYFNLNSGLRVKEFAQDIEELTVILKIGKAVPVTLSYSSSVGAYLNPKTFPHIIETVPLGTALEADPEAAQKTATWENWLRMNPFMAPFWIRQFRDQSYASHWNKVVDTNLKNDPEFYGANPRTSDIKAGYVAIARAVEDFNYTQWDFSAEKRTRDFVLAGNENPERLKNQIEVIKNYLATGKPARVVVVAGAGHIMPTDKPVIYSIVVGLLGSQPRQAPVQFAIVNPTDSVKDFEWKDATALDRWIKENQR